MTAIDRLIVALMQCKNRFDFFGAVPHSRFDWLARCQSVVGNPPARFIRHRSLPSDYLNIRVGGCSDVGVCNDYRGPWDGCNAECGVERLLFDVETTAVPCTALA